jgi:branched-subunit amino acid aminotransferase/4-amino-4-deoxychorismate lyase
MSEWPRGLRTGEGVFETLRWTGELPPTWQLHLDRMRHGAGVLGIPWPGDAAIVEHIRSAAGVETPWRMRLSLLADGGDPLTEAPLRARIAVESRPLRDEERHPGPVRLAIAAPIRNYTSLLKNCKHLGLAEALVERRRVRGLGADDALLLSTDGLVSETTTATLLLGMRDGTVATPDPVAAPLPGTTLAALERSRNVARVRLLPGDLERVQWALLLNAVVGARPVRSIESFTLHDPPAQWIAAVCAALGWQP